ncbi:MAG: hypothetical protein COB76_02965 [Alphaproteobacteria bacterium]|nr:MAG: hypothetical protein COB76_02965 [Alphaproteobacteria bacterium]
MSTTVENSFAKQFQSEVHAAYQRTGSKLRNTVRTIDDVKGATCVFQKVGKGLASTKSSNGMVPVMNLDHTAIEVQLQDYYAGDWIDKLDELKIQHDERQTIAMAGAYALGRKTDEMVINALSAATTSVADDTVGMTKAKLLEAYELLGTKEVPDDGQRFCIVGVKQWSELLSIEEFSSSDYVGQDELPWQGSQAKKFLGTTFMVHSGLPIDENDVRSCFWYHRTAVGHASGANVQTDISWHGDRAAHFVNSMMSQGAGLVDVDGIVVIPCDETPSA